MEEVKIINHVCAKCEQELNEFTAYPTSWKWQTTSGYLPYCIRCQEEYFNLLYKQFPSVQALFYSCVAFNIPFIMEHVPKLDRVTVPWKIYMEQLRVTGANLIKDSVRLENGEMGLRERYRNFFDGETDIAKIFGSTMHNTVDLIEKMQNAPATPRRTTPTQAQTKKWGAEYDIVECKELDERYNQLGAAYKGNNDPRIEQNIIQICKLQLALNKQMRIEDFAQVKRIQDTIKSIMETEGMKATDVKPMENFRIDAIAHYLERNGALKNNQIVSKDKLRQMLNKGKHSYSSSRDIVDEMILQIVNASRRNEGTGELYEIPLDMQVKDSKNELKKNVTEAEKAVLAELGTVLTPKQKHTRNRGGD